MVSWYLLNGGRMGFHVYTDGWWQKHAVTTEATIVEATRGKQGGDAWMHVYWWKLVADVSDPETGQIVRADGSTLTAEVFQPGQTIKIRWSAKRKRLTFTAGPRSPRTSGRRTRSEAGPGRHRLPEPRRPQVRSFLPIRPRVCSRRSARWGSAVPRVSRWYAQRGRVLAVASLIRSSSSRSSPTCARAAC